MATNMQDKSHHWGLEHEPASKQLSGNNGGALGCSLTSGFDKIRGHVVFLARECRTSYTLLFSDRPTKEKSPGSSSRVYFCPYSFLLFFLLFWFSTTYLECVFTILEHLESLLTW